MVAGPAVEARSGTVVSFLRTRMNRNDRSAHLGSSRLARCSVTVAGRVFSYDTQGLRTELLEANFLSNTLREQSEQCMQIIMRIKGGTIVRE